MAQPAWLNKYLVMKPEIERVFDELDTYLDFCRFELRDYNPAHLYDKSNQNYKTLLRSHTDEILAMDFHVQKQHIITVSKDKTIRLWDIQSNDEVYEFSSPVDQPLCVAAHPQQSIFACGFESGKMRIFDIDTTEVLDEFSQFNKPLRSLRYDNSGKLLIACCQDG